VQAFVDALLLFFIAVDALGVAPLYLGLTHELDGRTRQRVLRNSILVGGATSIAFALIGKAVFLLLGIMVADFKVAGGLVLVGIAARDIFGAEPRAVAAGPDVGVVPLGVPLIVGPGVITATIVLVDRHGPGITVLALIVNLGICWGVLAQAQRMTRLVGGTGARAASKVISLLLAAVGVQLVRQGLRG
jgi:multiple antibiotic resistance protein